MEDLDAKQKKIIEMIGLNAYNIEASDMGNGQEEIAEYVEGKLFDLCLSGDFKAVFFMIDNMNGVVIQEACDALGWDSTPSVGGLTLNIWDD